MKKVILAVAIIGLFACKKEEKDPNEGLCRCYETWQFKSQATNDVWTHSHNTTIYYDTCTEAFDEYLETEPNYRYKKTCKE